MNDIKTIFVLVVLYSVFCSIQGAVIPVGSTELYTNIEEAFNAANDSDILQLAPEIFSGIGNLQVDLSNKSITIIGNSTDSTIIDCGNSGRAFFSFSNDTFDLAFQDLTIQNCNAHGANANTSSTNANLTAITGWGGAFALISNSTASFKGVRFITNYASQGASLYISSNHSVSIENCYFFGNNATRGGGLYLLEIPSVTLVDTQFTNNRANQSGAAIWASATTFSITNTNFTSNVVSGSGAGLALLDNAQAVFHSCNFKNNTANNDGGAVFSNSGADLQTYDCLFDYNIAGEGGAVSLTNYGTLRSYDSVFTNNYAQAWGGAVYIQQAQAYFYNSTVQYNTAEQGGGAGAIWNEGEVDLVNSNFTENTSQRGGAFYLQYSSILQVVSSYIQYNSAAENGGGVYCSDSELFLNESTTLASNQSPSEDSTEIYCAEDIPYTYCKVHGVTNFTDYCHMPDEGDATATDQYDTYLIVGAVLIGGGFLVGCGSFVIYFLDPKHRKQQGFYWSAFKEDNEDDDAVPLPE